MGSKPTTQQASDEGVPNGLPTKVDWPTAMTRLTTAVAGGYKNHDRVLEAALALLGPALARGFEAIKNHPDGRRVLADKPDLLAVLGDTAYLESLPYGSLGAAYHDFLSRHRLDAGVFAEDQIRPVAEKNGLDGDVYYMLVRGTALHDMLHTLGGYGPDMGGELGNLGFHAGNIGDAPAFRAVAMLLAFAPMGGGGVRRRIQFFNEAVRRGRVADNLLAAYYEELLPLPLDEVRERLNIMPDRYAHPDGHIFTHWQPPGNTGVPPVAEPWVYPAISA
jgi:ubiquinone biosynthesis protein Coq4